jgi:peroxiredoxin
MFSYCSVGENQTDKSSIVKIGDKIPSFTVPGIDGEFSSSEFIGKKSILVFFQTTCPDCQRELPVIEQLWNSVKNDDGILVVTIARAQTEATVGAYWASEGFTMPWYYDIDKSVYSLFADSYVPRIYVIDSSGTVRWMAVERLGKTAAELEQILREV